jgi:DNA-binding NtrC family response regulator
VGETKPDFRTFRGKVGETKPDFRTFQGKVIAATNRDLAAEMRAGRFRPDFYYRLCADVITTPKLSDQLADRPEDLPDIVRYVVQRRVLRSEGSTAVPIADAEIDALVDEVVTWIGRNLESGYSWPGNFRELEQCVRNLMIRNHYQRPGMGEPHEPVEAFLHSVGEGSLSSDALLGKYYALVLLRTGSYAVASQRLGVDWRTLKKRIDLEFLSEVTRLARGRYGVLSKPAVLASGPPRVADLPSGEDSSAGLGSDQRSGSSSARRSFGRPGNRPSTSRK